MIRPAMMRISKNHDPQNIAKKGAPCLTFEEGNKVILQKVFIKIFANAFHRFSDSASLIRYCNNTPEIEKFSRHEKRVSQNTGNGTHCKYRIPMPLYFLK